MLPQFYQSHLQKQLKNPEYLTLKMLVYVWQSHKQISWELLATLMPYPILFESRRRSLQRFLASDCLNFEKLWFPLVKEILNRKFTAQKLLNLAIDRTQWRDTNVFVISLSWQKRAIPLYWEILEKKGSSNLAEQQALITPVLALFEGYEIVLLGDREFGRVKLASWLGEKKVKFVLRIKQSRYFQEEYQDYLHCSDLGLIPGSRFFLRSVQVTKQKGFGNFNVAAYWRRKYRGKVEDEGWYLLTNLTTFQQAVTACYC